MKICDITEFYAESSGGVRTYLSAKARYLTEQLGWDHVLIAPGVADTVERRGRALTYRIAGAPAPLARPYRLLLSASKVRAVLLRERPDVIEAGSPFLAPWVLRRALAGITPRPAVVGFYHSDFPAAYARAAGSRLGRTAGSLAERLAWRYARWVHSDFALTFAASPHVVNRLRDHGIGRVHPVSLGVDLALFHPGRRDPRLREHLGVGPGQMLLLYAGRLATEKGIDTLLSAFARLPQERYRLQIVGDGPRRSTVDAFARAHPSVVVHGHEADRERLAALYASSDLLLAPGRFETFGLSVVEAQASGLPALVVHAGATPDLLGTGAGLCVAPDDPAALAGAIAAVTPALREQMGERARAHAENRFSWNSVLAELARAYAHVARRQEVAA